MKYKLCIYNVSVSLFYWQKELFWSLKLVLISQWKASAFNSQLKTWTICNSWFVSWGCLHALSCKQDLLHTLSLRVQVLTTNIARLSLWSAWFSKNHPFFHIHIVWYEDWAFTWDVHSWWCLLHFRMACFTSFQVCQLVLTGHAWAYSVLFDSKPNFDDCRGPIR